VRLLHASPDAPPFDLYAGQSRQTLLAHNVTYGNATSSQSVGAGKQHLELAAADAPLDTRFSIEVNLRKGEKVDLVVAGEEARGTLQVVVLHENITPPSAGMVRLRVLNASPDATPISLDVGNDGTIELANLELFHASGEEGIEIAASSSHQLGIVIRGVNIGSFTLPPLPAGSEALLVPTGYVARDPADFLGLSLLAPGLGLVKQNSWLYVLNVADFHTNPNPSIDIGGGYVRDLKFGELARIPFNGGSSAGRTCQHGVPPTPEGCGEISTANLQPGQAHLAQVNVKVETVLGHGFNGAFDRGQADPQLQFINALLVSGVDIGLISDGQFTVFDGCAALGYLDTLANCHRVLPPGPSTLGLRPTGDSTVYLLETVLNSGSRAFALFAATPDDQGARTLQVFLIDTSTQPWSRTVFSLQLP
jgi:hypothetical protein